MFPEPPIGLHARLLNLNLALALLSLPSAQAAPALHILPGATNALGSLSHFRLPANSPTTGVVLFQDGNAPYQADAAGEAWFEVPAPFTGRQFDAKLGVLSASAPQVTAATLGNTVQFREAQHEVLRYQAQPGDLPRPDIDPLYRRGGYLSPIFSPEGRLVSDDFPPNHVHHHGIWSPWTKTQFEGRDPDFWNMGQGKGRVEFVALDGTTSGPVFAGFRARHRFVDMIAKPEKAALEETWDVRVLPTTFRGRRRCSIFDLTLTQTCASASPLQLPKYHYGGLGFRGNRAWDGATNCFFLTSNGQTNRIAGNETRGRWCWIGGRVDGAITGLAVLCHPSNFRAPQPMRLHPTEPFFCFAPSQLGDWEIQPGKPYVARYRFVVMEGPPDRAWLDRLWNGYAEPPRVETLAAE